MVTTATAEPAKAQRRFSLGIVDESAPANPAKASPGEAPSTANDTPRSGGAPLSLARRQNVDSESAPAGLAGLTAEHLELLRALRGFYVQGLHRYGFEATRWARGRLALADELEAAVVAAVATAAVAGGEAACGGAYRTTPMGRMALLVESALDRAADRTGGAARGDDGPAPQVDPIPSSFDLENWGGA